VVVVVVVRLEGWEAAKAIAVEAQDLKVGQRKEPAGHAAAQRVPRQVHKGQRPVQRARLEARLPPQQPRALGWGRRKGGAARGLVPAVPPPRLLRAPAGEVDALAGLVRAGGFGPAPRRVLAVHLARVHRVVARKPWPRDAAAAATARHQRAPAQLLEGEPADPPEARQSAVIVAHRLEALAAPVQSKAASVSARSGSGRPVDARHHHWQDLQLFALAFVVVQPAHLGKAEFDGKGPAISVQIFFFSSSLDKPQQQ